MGLYQSAQGPFYSIGKSGGNGCGAGLKNFKVRASNVAPQEGFEKSHFQEGIFENKKGRSFLICLCASSHPSIKKPE